MKITIILITFCWLIPLSAFSQDENISDDGYGSDGVLMLKEIEIKVDPELPTLVITIPRQSPVMANVEIKSPLGRLIEPDNSRIKPNLSEMLATPVKDSEKMLARERNL